MGGGHGALSEIPERGSISPALLSPLYQIRPVPRFPRRKKTIIIFAFLRHFQAPEGQNNRVKISSVPEPFNAHR